MTPSPSGMNALIRRQSMADILATKGFVTVQVAGVLPDTGTTCWDFKCSRIMGLLSERPLLHSSKLIPGASPGKQDIMGFRHRRLPQSGVTHVLYKTVMRL